MADEPHAVVRLLLARMESHPEEFRVGTGPERWEEYIDAILDYGNEADNAPIVAKLRDIRLAEIHQQVMDELLNGPEKRRKEVEEREYERQVMQQALQRNNQMSVQQAMQQKMQQAMQQYGGGGASLPVSTSPYQNALAQGIVGRSPTSILVDECANIGIGNGGTDATMGTITASQPNNTLTDTINQIKQALGIKNERV